MRLVALMWLPAIFSLEIMKVKTPPKPLDVMVQIDEGSSSLPPQLQPFDLNGDGIIDEEEEKLCRFAIDAYFSEHKINKDKVKVHLKKYIQDANNSPLSEERETVAELRRVMSGETSGATSRSGSLPLILLKALATTLQDTEQTSIPKKKAYGTTIITGLLGVASTLLIKFIDNGCDK